MTITYRNAGAWGAGKGSPLTSLEVDNNFYNHDTRIAAIEGSPPVAVSIASVSLSGNLMYVTLTDSTILGPFTIPAGFTFRGEWQPSTHYLVNDWITGIGALYTVAIDHTSSSGTFDPLATDGSGHDLYTLLLQAPSNVLPTGGATGQVLVKSTSADYAVTWDNLDAIDVTFTGSTASTLVSTDVAAALDELAARDISPLFIDTPTTSQVLTFDGTEWTNEDLPAVPTTLTGLTDVSLSSPTSGQVFTYNGFQWINQTLSVAFSQISSIVITSATLGDTLSFDGVHWVNGPAAAGRFSTVTALGSSGTVTLDPTLSDVFTLSPVANVTIAPSSYPAGAHITIVITTVNATGYTVSFSGHEMYDGDLVLPKQSGVTVSISFVGDGTNFNLVSRAAPRQAKVLGTSGGVSVSPTFGGLFTCTPTNDITFSATYAPIERDITILITTSGTTSRTMTFGSGFKTTGTLATGVVSGAVFTLRFVGDGTNFNEIARTVAM